jgi:hypothetical protein
MKEVNQISEQEKDNIAKSLSDLYNPKSVGNIEKYPPHGEYFVSLYYDTDIYSIKISNRYNHTISKDNDNPSNDLICDFELSNMNKVGNDLNVTVKVTKQ